MLIQKIPQKIFHHSQEGLSMLLGRGGRGERGGRVKFPFVGDLRLMDY